MPTAVIIGATSGIGRELAVQLHGRGFRVGVAGRRGALLDELVRSLGSERCQAMVLDLADHTTCLSRFQTLAAALGTVDFVYLVAGTGFLNARLDWALEQETLEVNCLGFAALAGAAVQLFREQNSGHLVGITSVAAVRPSGAAPAYGASKQFQSVYLEALRYRILKQGLRVLVTEVRPGFVDTAMMKADKPFWVISPARAARLIIQALRPRSQVIYVPRRWGLLVGLMRILPDFFYAKKL